MLGYLDQAYADNTENSQAAMHIDCNHQPMKKTILRLKLEVQQVQ